MKISVCMASFNGEKYILDQVNSILKQISIDDELIISDDGSNDSTIMLLELINDARVKLIVNHGEKGYTRNFENALNHITGDVVFLTDQDDIWFDDKVILMKEALKSSDLVVSDAKVVNKDLNTIHESHFRICSVEKGFLKNFIGTRYIGACMAFKSELLKLILPFPRNQQLCPHDYWITIVSELYSKVELIDQPLILYRRHDSNASSAGIGKGRSLRVKVSTRIYCAFHLLLRMKNQKKMLN